MAAIKLSLLLIVATIGLVLSTVFTFNWAAEVDAPASESTQTDATRAKIEEMWKSIQNEYYMPKAMLKKLEELKEILDASEASGKTEEIGDIKKQVGDLIEAGKFEDESLCDNDKIKQIATDIKNNNPLSGPLDLYMRYSNNQFLNKCADRMLRKMSLDLLNTYGSNPYHAIVNFVLEFEEAFKNSKTKPECGLRNNLRRDFSNVSDYREDFINSLYSYLHEKWVVEMKIAESYGRRGEFRPLFFLTEYYEQHIIGPCKLWLHVSRRMREIYNYINQNIIDQDMYKKIAAAFVCEYIYSDERILIELWDVDRKKDKTSRPELDFDHFSARSKHPARKTPLPIISMVSDINNAGRLDELAPEDQDKLTLIDHLKKSEE